MLRVPRTFWAALAVGALLRVALILASPAAGMSGGDLQVYHGTAVRLAESPGAWFEASEFGYRAPLYFVLLAVSYLPFPSGQAPYWAGQLVTAALFVPLVLLYVALGSQLRLRQREVIATVWLRSALPTFVVSDVQTLSEPLFEVLLLCLFLVASKAFEGGLTRQRGVILGLLLGALVLTREVGSVFVLGLALPFLAALRWRRMALPWRPIAWMAFTVGITLSPWLYRNHLTYDQALPLSTTGGVNLHIGHHPDADGRWGLILDPSHTPPANLRWGTPQFSKWHRDAAVAYILNDPLRALAIVPWKLAYLVFPRVERQETLDMFPGLPQKCRVVLLVLVGLSSAILVMLIPPGLAALPRSYYRGAALVSTVLVAAAVAVTYGSPRYLDPIEHLALPGIGALLVGPRRVLAERMNAIVTRVTVLSCMAGIVCLWVMILSTKF